MLTLIGEQPIPNLLPIRHDRAAEVLLVHTGLTLPVSERLRRIVQKETVVHLCPVDAYDLAAIQQSLEQKIKELGWRINQVVFNLTGGTKMMVLAAFALAARNNSPFIYLQSEGQHSRLFRYQLAQGATRLVGQEEIPPVISAGDYLNAHLPGYEIVGFATDETGKINIGGRFEQAIHTALKTRFETLPGVRPKGVADQIELDLVIRCGNQVGIAEVKLGGDRTEGPKRGIDQLNTATRREYLGTYTTRFLITGGRLGGRIRALAKDARIHLIELPGYQDGQPLAQTEVDKLVQAIQQNLCGKK
jgi:hypothetical protein